MCVFGLFRTEAEIEAIVLNNTHIMMRDRGYTLKESTGGRGEYIEARVYGKNKSLPVLVIVERADAKEKKEQDARNLELLALFLSSEQSQARCYRYCVFVHQRPSLTLKQVYTLLHTIKTQMPQEWHLPACQLFPRSFFHINIPRHKKLQPRFVAITDAQFAEYMGYTLEQARQEKHNLPKMKWKDSIRRYYNYSNHSIILIVHNGECTVQGVRFRIVIKEEPSW